LKPRPKKKKVELPPSEKKSKSIKETVVKRVSKKEVPVEKPKKVVKPKVPLKKVVKPKVPPKKELDFELDMETLRNIEVDLSFLSGKSGGVVKPVDLEQGKVEVIFPKIPPEVCPKCKNSKIKIQATIPGGEMQWICAVCDSPQLNLEDKKESKVKSGREYDSVLEREPFRDKDWVVKGDPKPDYLRIENQVSRTVFLLHPGCSVWANFLDQFKKRYYLDQVRCKWIWHNKSYSNFIEPSLLKLFDVLGWSVQKIPKYTVNVGEAYMVPWLTDMIYIIGDNAYYVVILCPAGETAGQFILDSVILINVANGLQGED
jgi:hypothetical protein